ncbi:MAG: peptidylprolyl isomerase [Coleofasciculaceae cyanobacterium SM2_3_26]|nr:peptidylprolyl isomerase [Coleofasciculaceae cyanobacterium SM2_3_26]
MGRLQAGMQAVARLCLLFTLAIGLCAALPAGNAITDGRAILRYALPVDNIAVRRVQSNLEDIGTQLRANRRWSAIDRDISTAQKALKLGHTGIVSAIAPEAQPQGEAILAQLASGLEHLQATAKEHDKEQVWIQRGELLNLVGQVEELMVDGFPYEVPSEYADLPQLKGRATVEVTTEKGSVILVVDGYSAPVTAGNFVDLVQRGFYDGLAFTRSENSYVLQVGDPPGKEVGFIDPETGTYRAIPLEILVNGASEPTYGATLEDLGMYLEKPVLPFSAYGTVAMARPESDPNGASSQFFFFLFEPELTPAGLNLLDGRYAVFGYVVDGKDALEKLKEGDAIASARVVDGLDHLVVPE